MFILFRIAINLLNKEVKMCFTKFDLQLKQNHFDLSLPDYCVTNTLQLSSFCYAQHTSSA